VLESTWKVVGKELIVTPKPSKVTQDQWTEDSAGDGDAIQVPWDKTKKAVAYALKGAEVTRRDVRR
jgi:hypothetical protein